MDGHFASVFPKSEAIVGAETVYHTQTEVFAVKDRLTISANVILKSKKLIVNG